MSVSGMVRNVLITKPSNQFSNDFWRSEWH